MIFVGQFVKLSSDTKLLPWFFCLWKFRKLVGRAADLHLGEQIRRREAECCCQEGEARADRRDVQTVENHSKVFCLGLRCLWRQQKGRKEVSCARLFQDFWINLLEGVEQGGLCSHMTWQWRFLVSRTKGSRRGWRSIQRRRFFKLSKKQAKL